MVEHGFGGMTVERLVQSPALQMQVLAGGAGLGRRVAWAHVSELADPSPWLAGGELIMTTGLGVPRAAAPQRAYVERLDDGGVAGLAVSAHLHTPRITRAALAAADERGFPILEVPLSVPFIAIAQEVAAAVQADSTQRLNAQLQVFGAVRWLTSGELDEGQVFARLSRLSGLRLYLCTVAGAPLFPDVAAPPPELRRLLPTDDDAPPTVPGGFVLPVPVAGGTGGWLLALEREGVANAGLAVVQHIATVAALQLTMRRHGEEILRREGAETFADLLQGDHSAEAIVRRLRRVGFRADVRLQLIALRSAAGAQGRAAGAGAAGSVRADEVARALADGGLPHLLLNTGDVAYVLIRSGPRARTVLAGIPELRVGASRPFEVGAPLGLARREALWACARADDAGLAYVRYGSDTIGRWTVEDAASLRALVASVLGVVQAYDDEHDSDLVRTVQTWLERERQTAPTAEALHVHPNTLAYRLKRFEELSGRNLRSTADLAELWLALRALGHLEVEQPG
ncbi:PucR family transcriptional regulator [Microlunatus ginsengisoli]|uniref:PucR family transcriptional regulator n=1 Tax=Microlunatus ginsengisoli TaxID=363863 RepID=A0ABP7AIX2_9ACTN